jgi:hypothetical protein
MQRLRRKVYERSALPQSCAAGNWQAFSIALRTLQYSYFRLEEARAELHPISCWGCSEIRNFLSTPDYRGDREDPIGVEYQRP